MTAVDSTTAFGRPICRPRKNHSKAWALVKPEGKCAPVLCQVTAIAPMGYPYGVINGWFNGNERFYDLSNDAGENTNLLNGTLSDEAENALNVLRAKAEEIRQ